MLRPLIALCMLLTALVLLSMAGCRTPKLDRSAKVYAFMRTVMPGMIPDRSNQPARMNGEPRERAIENYFIYLSKPDPTITNVTIWIRGKSYNATLQEINELPIVIESGGPGIFKISDTLVPAIPGHVWRILPGDAAQSKTPRMLRGQGQKPEAVVEFMHNGKHVLAFSKEFKKLTPIVLE